MLGKLAHIKRNLSVLVGSAFVFVSCSRSWTWADYAAIHKDGTQKLPACRQMNTNYAEVDNFIVHFGSGKQPLEWHTVAYIEGRFELTYVQPVTVDYAKQTVTAAGNPRFYLHAAETIRMLDAERAQVTYDSKLQREFGKAEWDEFAASGFDLTTLGIPKIEIYPVQHWKERVHGARKDRVPIK